MSKSYKNKVELKDDQIILFHRQGAKRPIWHMRIHVRGMRDVNGTKLTYIQETTGEKELDEAKRVALEKFDDLRLRVRDKKPARELRFRDMYEIWWSQKVEELKATALAKGRTVKIERVEWHGKYATRYFLAYFGDLKLDGLEQPTVQGFWPWRLNYWENAGEEERKKYPNHALTPSKKTLDMEQAALREIFGWAHANKLITYMPIIKHPLSRKGVADKRRASFEPDEWDRIRTYLDEWSIGKGKNDGRVNTAHIYRRKLCRLFIHWMVNTGMRTGEVFAMRHRDIKSVRAAEGVASLQITVSQQTKTGSRVVWSMTGCISVYEEVCDLTGHTKPNDFVFCGSDGKKLSGFYKTLDHMLNDIGLLLDRNGDKRTLYSFRHFYAESMFRLIGLNPKAFDMLSANMGTSRLQLEKHYIRKGVTHEEDALVASTQYEKEEGRKAKKAFVALDAMTNGDDSPEGMVSILDWLPYKFENSEKEAD